MAQITWGIFYPEHVAVARGLLTDAEIGQLFLAVSDYVESGSIPDIPSKSWGVCFDLMRGAIDKNAQRYLEKCERNKRNIEKRWNRQETPANEYDGIPSNTTEYDGIPSNTNIKKEKERKEKEGKNIDSVSRKARFTPPTVDEVRAYCRERGNSVDAQRFVDFYTANGWKVGKNSMRDWKAAVRTWERSDAQQKGASSFGTLYGDY